MNNSLKKFRNKFLVVIILFSFVFQIDKVFADDLPELPSLPEFDNVLPPEGMDAFAPSETPAQIAEPKPQISTPQGVNQAKVQTTSKQAVSSSQVAKSATVKANNKQAVTKTTLTPVNKTKTTSNGSQKNNTTQTPQKVKLTTQKTYSSNSNNSYYTNNSKTFVVPKGKKFKVVLANNISSNTPIGTRVTFKSLYPETSRYITIPAGTTFYGKVTDSHPPQYTGNGGLIVIKVTQMVYKGRSYPIEATVSVADGQRIFFNNIKGERTYLKSIPKAIKPGANYFSKMWKVTKRLARNESGVEIILTPFSFTAGAVVYVANFIASPVLAIFYKGNSITIPANSKFTIKLREDAILY